MTFVCVGEIHKFILYDTLKGKLISMYMKQITNLPAFHAIYIPGSRKVMKISLYGA
jgi:hypothetical protein